MSQVIKRFRSGNVSASVWEGDYQGQKTYSFSFQKAKFNKQTNLQEFSEFFNETDLADLQMLAAKFALDSINAKGKTVEPKQTAQPSYPTQSAQPTYPMQPNRPASHGDEAPW